MNRTAWRQTLLSLLWYLVGSTLAVVGGHLWLVQESAFSWHFVVAMIGLSLVAQSGRHMERGDRARRLDGHLKARRWHT